jgi:hypothetical protein
MIDLVLAEDVRLRSQLGHQASPVVVTNDTPLATSLGDEPDDITSFVEPWNPVVAEYLASSGSGFGEVDLTSGILLEVPPVPSTIADHATRESLMADPASARPTGTRPTAVPGYCSM